MIFRFFPILGERSIWMALFHQVSVPICKKKRCYMFCTKIIGFAGTVGRQKLQLNSNLCNSDKFEVSCLSSKSWPILKIFKKLNSQDVKDSEWFKTSLVSACFEAFWGSAKFKFSTDLNLNWLRALWSLDQIQPNLVWMHLLTVENTWYGRK